MPARAELFLSIRFPRVHTLAVNAGGGRKACSPGPADATLERKRKEKQRVSGRSHSRATHAAGRDFPKIQNALSPRSVLFFWTVHGPFSFRQDRMGPPQEPSAAVPVGRGGARERTQFSPSGGNGVKRTLRRRQWGVECPVNCQLTALLSNEKRTEAAATSVLLFISPELFSDGQSGAENSPWGASARPGSGAGRSR